MEAVGSQVSDRRKSSACEGAPVPPVGMRTERLRQAHLKLPVTFSINRLRIETRVMKETESGAHGISPGKDFRCCHTGNADRDHA